MSAQLLSRIVAVLGPQVVTVVSAPSGLDVNVASARIYDPRDPDVIASDELLLAVNISPADIPTALAVAATARACAVMVRSPVEELTQFASVAERTGIGLLAVAELISWDQALRIVTAVCSPVTSPLSPDDPVRDLFSLADAIAALVGGAVTIEDAQSRLLAYSSLGQPIDQARQDTILGRRLGDSWNALLKEHGGMGQLASEPGRVVRLHDAGGRARDRLAASVGTPGELLGYIWVVEGDVAFTDDSQQVLRDSCALAALHLLKQRSRGDLDRYERGSQLRRVLDGACSPREAAASLGLRQDESCAVAVFNLGAVDPVEITLKRGKAVAAITVAAEAFRRSVVCAWVDNRIYALFPSVHETGRARLLSMVQNVTASTAASLRLPIHAGVGSIVDSINEMLTSRHEADRVVDVLLHANGALGISGHIDDLRVPAALAALRHALRDSPEFRLPAFEVLRAQDARADSAYLETLRVFALSLGSKSETAAMLRMHINSVRYRISRIEELTGLNLSDPATLHVVAAHFYVYPPPS